MKPIQLLLMFFLFLAAHAVYAGEKITIAAAADIKFAMDEIVGLFDQLHPQDQVTVIYGSSGKFQNQIRQGAPYDLYFSADIAYPAALKNEGLVTGEVQPYALGRIVLWSATRKANKLNLNDLADPSIQRISIANPQHAPYGKCAEEALKKAGVWDKVEAKLIYGEDIAQTAQYVQTGNADIGIIALSLAKSAELSRLGGYALIPDSLHQPLEQGFVLTRRATGNPLALEFSRFMARREVRAIMIHYGFILPGEK